MNTVADPCPTPPEKPLPTDCCGGGCMPCVLEAYEEALEDYRTRLGAWLDRHPDGEGSAAE